LCGHVSTLSVVRDRPSYRCSTYRCSTNGPGAARDGRRVRSTGEGDRGRGRDGGDMQAVGIMAGPVALAGGRTDRARHDEAPLRLTRPGRAVLVLLAGLVLGVGARGGVAGASGPGGPVEVRVHGVSSGETLWQLARGVAAPREDARDVASGLVRRNGVSSSGVQARQKLLPRVEEG